MRDTSRLGDANERGQLMKHWKSLFKRCGSASRIFFPSNNVSAAGFDMRRSTDATGDARTWYDAGQQSGQRVQLGDFLGRQQFTRLCQAYVCVRRIRRARQGSLEPGKLADLAVLSQDIFTVPAKELPKTRPVVTLVGGRIV